MNDKALCRTATATPGLLKSLGKTFLIMWSHIFEKNGNMCPTNGFEKSVLLSFKDLCVFTFLHFFQNDFIDYYSYFTPNQRPYFQNSFS